MHKPPRGILGFQIKQKTQLTIEIYKLTKCVLDIERIGVILWFLSDTVAHSEHEQLF
jgi:hypothetical protein